MQIDLLTPRIDRLSSDGQLTCVHEGDTLGRVLRRPVLLLSRDLCSFSLFQTSPLPRSRRRQAAQLQARAAAPFVRSSSLLVKTGDDFGIWWWDQDRLEALMPVGLAQTRPVVAPEALVQPTTQMVPEAWRHVRLSKGYELQFWRDKTLVATAWRPEKHNEATYQAFVRLQRPEHAAPERLPVPVDLPVVYNARRLQAPISINREKAALLGGASLVTASLCFAAYLSGQSLEVKKATEVVVAHTDRIRAATPHTSQSDSLGQEQKQLAAYQEIENRTNPMSAAGAAIGILAYHDISPQSMKAETDQISLVIGYGYLEKIETLVQELETSGYFYDIRPKADRAAQTLTLEMKSRETAPPLGEADFG